MLQAARARGLSQGKITQFLQENPDDYQRLKDVEPDEAQASAAVASSPAAPAGAPLGGPPTVGATAISGLMGAAPSGGGAAALMQPGEEFSPLAQESSGAAALRQMLGTRLYPQESMILAGLKRAY